MNILTHVLLCSALSKVLLFILTSSQFTQYVEIELKFKKILAIISTR